MEDDFVQLGQALRSLYSIATELAQGVRERAGNLQGALLDSRIAGPDGLAERALSELQAGLDRTSGLLRTLEGIGSELQKLHNQMHSVKRIGLFLKASVFSFAIESSRTAECQQAFGCFVDELRALASQIGTGCDTLNDQVRTTESLQAQGRAAMGGNLKEMHQLAREVETAAQGASTKAQKMLDGSLTALQQAEGCTRQIAQSAGEAVYHLQFGDIVRQKLEHVTGALQKAASLLEAGGSADELGRNEAEASYLIGIQVAQMELVRREVQAAHTKLAQAFQSIASETARLLEMLQLTQARGEADSLQALKREALRLETLRSRSGGLQEEARQGARHAAEASRTLHRHLDSLNEINREMHLQALNATIKTTSLRGQGATLEVLSTEVASLFRESNRAVTGIVSSLEHILRAAEQAEAEPAAVAAETDAKRDPDNQLREALTRITAAYDEFKQASNQAARLADKQQGALAAGQTSLEFLPVLTDSFALQCQDLSDLRRRLAPIRGDAKPFSPEVTPALDQSYTMQSERDIHKSVTRGLQPSGPSSATAGLEPLENFEFFDSAGPALAEPAADSVPAGAGSEGKHPLKANRPEPGPDDNIELF